MASRLLQVRGNLPKDHVKHEDTEVVLADIDICLRELKEKEQDNG